MMVADFFYRFVNNFGFEIALVDASAHFYLFTPGSLHFLTGATAIWSHEVLVAIAMHNPGLGFFNGAFIAGFVIWLFYGLGVGWNII